ncbi:hypothetical protein HPB48_012141 [Haemaphysalis longicornis]|uniref:Uncharacterized protein n=1 Tax=Haemaphysalis longicornis TaxID=44386 RepID=A0A9J6GA72_HAELO|nr:hypothetical protein HPB48_012141 [Haemaphysalis longicornis]
MANSLLETNIVSKTRWDGVILLLQSLLKNKVSPQEAATIYYIGVAKPISPAIFYQDVFSKDPAIRLDMLPPVSSGIIKLQTHQALLSDVLGVLPLPEE